jgi:predicted transglutaminase-like cysteine proteinase
MWVQYPADGKGDCEDYALTKLGMLEQLGVPVVTNTKLVSVIVKEPGGVEGHEILAILMPKGAVLYLDNMNRHLMTRPELEREGYTFFDWKA